MRLACLALAVSIFAAGFAHGFISHRNRIFPYEAIQTGFRRLQVLTNEERGATQTFLFQEKAANRDLYERLEVLGYLQGYQPAGDRSGIVVYEPARAQPGVNLYVSAHRPGATLMDMSGTTLREWTEPFEGLCPDDVVPNRVAQLHWRRVRPLHDGSLLVIFDYGALFKLNPRGEVAWKRCDPYHHDLSVDGDGNIITLRRRRRIVPSVDSWEPILDDEIEVLSGSGKTISRISIADAIGRSTYAPLLDRVDLSRTRDVFHTNTVKVLDGRSASRLDAFRRGNFLVSLRYLDLLAIVDADRQEVVWSLTGMFRAQHEPLLLQNGHMLLFDNLGNAGRSRVIEFDPLTQEISWSYVGLTEEGFLSYCCGSNQRLSNGNTLITDTDNGRAVEVTQDGRVVWQFLNPHRAGEHDELVAVLMDVIRIEDDAWGSRLQGGTAETTTLADP